MKKKTLMGGQAVIEGVMMKSGLNVAISVRNEKGKIVSTKEKLKQFRHSWMRLPFIRGVINLIEMLFVGTRALIWSANQMSEEEEEFTTWELIMLLASSFGFSILFFVLLPYIATDFFGVVEADNPILFNIIDGIIKIIFFIAYVFAISLMSDVRRLFEYHGAEHKAVWCYESEKKLTPRNCQKFSRLHPRCGTSFIMIVFVVSVIVFSFIPYIVFNLFPSVHGMSLWLQKLILFPIRLMFIPVIAGFAYETLMLTARYSGNILARMLILPGLGLQLLTTKEPDYKQLEVAIRSLEIVLKMR